jgi:RNA polymerase sigma factor (sigma-70 family)
VVELAPDVLRDALAGDRRALATFVAALTPVIQARVVRALVRRRSSADGRDVRQEMEDMTQDVFSALFAHGGHALRAWDPARGLSLANFVGLVADRQVATILRSGRKNPWRDRPEELDALEAAALPVPDAEPQLESRSALERLLDRMREALSPRGLELFQRLYVEEEPIDDVARAMGMTREAIYAWRNRVGKLLRAFAAEIREDDAGAALDPCARPRNPGETPRDG